MRMNRFEEAVALAERALPAAEARGLSELTVELLITRGVALVNMGRRIESVATLTGAMAMAERLNLPSSVLRAIVNLGYALEPEDPASGFRVSREGVEKARGWGQRWAVRYLIGNACDGAIAIGHWDWALEQLRDELEHDQEPAEQLWFGSLRAQILASRGEPMADEIATVVALAAGYDDTQYKGIAAVAQMAEMMASGRYVEVIELCRIGLGWASQGAKETAPPVGARAALRLGDADVLREMLEAYGGAREGRRTDAERAWISASLAAVEGRRSEARAQYIDSIRRWQELDLSWLVALTGLDAIVAGVLDASERQRVADETRAIMERLGAAPYLNELENALARPPSEATVVPSSSAERVTSARHPAG